MIQKWLNLMHEKGCNILGYQAKREDNEDDECNVPNTLVLLPIAEKLLPLQ